MAHLILFTKEHQEVVRCWSELANESTWNELLSEIAKQRLNVSSYSKDGYDSLLQELVSYKQWGRVVLEGTEGEREGGEEGGEEEAREGGREGGREREREERREKK